MARHIMAVCVVCLICADRLHCEQHFKENHSSESNENLEYEKLSAKAISQRSDMLRNLHLESTNRHFRGDDFNDYRNGKQDRSLRQKRHAAAILDITCSQPKITEDFLHHILNEFADGGDLMSKNKFQHLLRQLGLQQLLDHNYNSSCISDQLLVQHVQPHDAHHQIANHTTFTGGATNCSLDSVDTIPCEHVSTEEEEQAHDKHSKNYTLSAQDVLNLCPVLLYQLTTTSDPKHSGCIDSSILESIDNYEITQQLNDEHVNTIHVWIYAFISVFLCSILGLVGVAIIPFMDSRYYKHIIQFLVSLAVGTMTGDAVLHLLPHSLSGQTERNMIFKGLTCMGGIIFFYITEHGLTMISEWRKSIARKEAKKPSRVKVMREPDSSVNNSVVGDKLCKSKYSSYPYCYEEIAMDTSFLHLPTNNTSELRDDSNNVNLKRNGKSETEGGEMATQSLLSTSQNNYAPVAEANFRHQHHLPGSNTVSTDLDGNSVSGGIMLDSRANGNNGSKEKEMANDTVTVILREHESSHHGHSHKHGHVHSPPESLSAVAWMIIMGDGLHNFTDGMAIGAAFADNIAGGFSTSLAVFCHELPHELGDFAILMKAGMSVKSAVYYNLLTGVLSFIGMIFGIVFGQTQEAAQWMFAAAAGLFIYIALVDMMPELSAAHKSLEQFVLQILGMSSGVFLMLLIAIYEDDLMNVFLSPPIH